MGDERPEPLLPTGYLILVDDRHCDLDVLALLVVEQPGLPEERMVDHTALRLLTNRGFG